MSLAYPFQKFQDWCTQQWSILWGRSFDPAKEEWLMGPFGQVGSTGDDFVYQLAEKEGLTVSRKVSDRGLIPRVQDLNLPEEEYARLSEAVIDFYQQTGQYSLQFAVEWNPLFKFLGKGVRVLFSERINQLNVPIKNLREGEEVNSEIITLSDPKSGQVRYTIWYRSFKGSGEVLYSGAYGLCTPPSGKVHVKAVFPCEDSRGLRAGQGSAARFSDCVSPDAVAGIRSGASRRRGRKLHTSAFVGRSRFCARSRPVNGPFV